ncbi:hypothetical protein CLV30_101113 [Haloactinopolyspora alba]|uniref:Uncharacterized protein n=1 Tax=Haloactinopolyspora alba TaxID=648780 RepID=A0A2P8EFA8_9ACTN|nr:hypothetical protein CLV30_101113 [Haloactinopolyspora alba]
MFYECRNSTAFGFRNTLPDASEHGLAEFGPAKIQALVPQWSLVRGYPLLVHVSWHLEPDLSDAPHEDDLAIRRP